MQFRHVSLVAAWVVLGGLSPLNYLRADNPDAPADIEITNKVLVPAAKAPPLGVNEFGDSGAVKWARNNFIRNAGNEPAHWRNLHRVMSTDGTSFEIDAGGGTSGYNLWGDGFLSGARLRIYRLVDKEGNTLPALAKVANLDTTKADHVKLVADTTVMPEGSPGFPEGGWVVSRYSDVHPNGFIRSGNLSATDALDLQIGRTYWYTVVALDSKGKESEIVGEISATPDAKAESGPHLLVCTTDDIAPPAIAGKVFKLEPKVIGGRGKLSWSVVDAGGKPAALPQGLTQNAATGSIQGKLVADIPANMALHIRVTDASGRSDTRTWICNPTDTPAGAQKLVSPTGLKAVAGNGFVTVSWQASSDAVGYRLKRSTAPLAKQANRVYPAPGAPKIEPYDYVVVEKTFVNFDLKHVNTRVRGIGNEDGQVKWYWNAAPEDNLRFSLVPHPKPVPQDMLEPGETCMEIVATGPASMYQTVMIGTEHGNESLWYGQLEPGKKYRLEVWMRQQNLADNGAVTFDYGDTTKTQYPGITQTFHVTGEWKKYTYDFVGPDRPGAPMHFGHRFTLAGAGTLWMDNCRIFRFDSQDELARPYVPNATVLNELMGALPPTGPKGTQRCWVQSRNITMKGLLSWHTDSHVNVNWMTSIAGNEELTLPCALEACYRTGKSPADRVVPWITIQHILHSEQDWLGFVEYMCAPYDPALDSPEKKPWAYMRYQQRGVSTPWIDEFRETILEFGNETWHNGKFPDWLGFSIRGYIWQGAHEYGIFCHYLIDNIMHSPYWRPEFKSRLRFALNDGYGRRDFNGKRLSYGETALLSCPEASLLTHANYVGPKWETGEKSQSVMDDHGMQATLLAYLTGNHSEFEKTKAMQLEMARSGIHYDLAAYESGPSGYVMRGQGTPEMMEVGQRYGRSLAMGIAALDGWLDAYQCGWTYQNFFTYGQGRNWNSHTSFASGFLPSTGWLAMKLRNLYAAGDQVVVEPKAQPTLKFGKQEYPLIGVYAFHEGRTWSVFVLSRKLDGQHDSHNFGDGHTPVTLRLPFQTAQKVTLHMLTGNPRDTNTEKLNIQLTSETLSPDAVKNGVLNVGGGKKGMPPGSAYLYVIDASDK